MERFDDHTNWTQSSDVTRGGGLQGINQFDVYNDSGEAIPAYSPMLITERVAKTTGGFYLKVGKPTADSQHQVVFNGGWVLPYQKFSKGTLEFTRSGICAGYNGTAPTIGSNVGTQTGSWKMKSGNLGWLVLAVDTARSLVYIRPSGGGGSTLSVVQAVADGSNGSVSVKTVVHKVDLSASPNFYQSGDATTVNYFKI